MNFRSTEMNEQLEINRGYIDHVRELNQVRKRSASAPTVAPRQKAGLRSFLYALIAKPLVAAIVLIDLSIFLEIWLRISLLFNRPKRSKLTVDAVACVDEFVEQYPFHLYPIVCKAFELAYLEAELPKFIKPTTEILEIAIGEGTLSARVFPPEASVVGLDLSPYSLKKASEKPHVRQSIVCDCLTPPIRNGSFDLLIANNFLHHVTRKEEALQSWAQIAREAVFNENTPTWASGWPKPYILKKLGRPDEAAEAAAFIENQSLQSLETMDKLETKVSKNYEILASNSYMSERTFFYCGLYSFFMRCYGPPTPPHLKPFFLSRGLGWLVRALTADVAKLLIRYDEYQDRSTDSFVSYVCKSKNFATANEEGFLACPNCHDALSSDHQCLSCGAKFSQTDGMLFLLPRELEDLQREYDTAVSAQTPREHL